jgi:hypothetical protein
MLFLEKDYQKQLSTYQEYLAISLTNPTEQMVAFSLGCKQKFTLILNQIIEEGIAKGEICEDARDLVPALLLFEKGLVVDTRATGIDARQEIEQLLDTLFKLIAPKEVK